MIWPSIEEETLESCAHRFGSPERRYLGPESRTTWQAVFGKVTHFTVALRDSRIEGI